LSNLKNKLLKNFSKLSEQDKDSLASYAEFLATRENTMNSSVQEISEPLDIPPPENESVIKAIKRLSATYPMLDKSILLNEISSHMTQHLIRGVAATEVIKNLENAFKNEFKKWQS